VDGWCARHLGCHLYVATRMSLCTHAKMTSKALFIKAECYVCTNSQSSAI
jgi:hypothetical protein